MTSKIREMNSKMENVETSVKTRIGYPHEVREMMIYKNEEDKANFDRPRFIPLIFSLSPL